MHLTIRHIKCKEFRDAIFLPVIKMISLLRQFNCTISCLSIIYRQKWSEIQYIKYLHWLQWERKESFLWLFIMWISFRFSAFLAFILLFRLSFLIITQNVVNSYGIITSLYTLVMCGTKLKHSNNLMETHFFCFQIVYSVTLTSIIKQHFSCFFSLFS